MSMIDILAPPKFLERMIDTVQCSASLQSGRIENMKLKVQDLI